MIYVVLLLSITLIYVILCKGNREFKALDYEAEKRNVIIVAYEKLNNLYDVTYKYDDKTYHDLVSCLEDFVPHNVEIKKVPPLRRTPVVAIDGRGEDVTSEVIKYAGVNGNFKTTKPIKVGSIMATEQINGDKIIITDNLGKKHIYLNTDTLIWDEKLI